jgi:hypothetical protein
MLIDEYARKPAGTEEKEIKVRIPLDYHIRLHAVKVVRGQPISDTVRLALEHYFEGLRMGPQTELNEIITRGLPPP